MHGTAESVSHLWVLPVILLLFYVSYTISYEVDEMILTDNSLFYI